MQEHANHAVSAKAIELANPDQMRKAIQGVIRSSETKFAPSEELRPKQVPGE